MPIRRKSNRANVSKMHSLRTGGRVSLFNYNPSIAGGKIAIKRFGRAHHMGRPLRHNAQKHMVSIVGAEGQGLVAPGSHARSGMGAEAPSAIHSLKEGRKRVLDAIHDQFAKRARK